MGAAQQAQLLTADRLRNAAQFFDPFKFVTYAEPVGKEHRPMPARIERENGHE